MTKAQSQLPKYVVLEFAQLDHVFDMLRRAEASDNGTNEALQTKLDCLREARLALIPKDLVFDEVVLYFLQRQQTRMQTDAVFRPRSHFRASVDAEHVLMDTETTSQHDPTGYFRSTCHFAERQVELPALIKKQAEKGGDTNMIGPGGMLPAGVAKKITGLSVELAPGQEPLRDDYEFEVGLYGASSSEVLVKPFKIKVGQTADFAPSKLLAPLEPFRVEVSPTEHPVKLRVNLHGPLYTPAVTDDGAEELSKLRQTLRLDEETQKLVGQGDAVPFADENEQPVVLVPPLESSSVPEWGLVLEGRGDRLPPACASFLVGAAGFVVPLARALGLDPSKLGAKFTFDRAAGIQGGFRFDYMPAGSPAHEKALRDREARAQREGKA